MKTTIDIADALLAEAKRIARREHTTVRELVETGLRRVVAERRRRTPFRLRKASFDGDGMRAPVRDVGWDGVLSAIYEGRGGV
jgi:Arc/MetJ family transcription regulator